MHHLTRIFWRLAIISLSLFRLPAAVSGQEPEPMPADLQLVDGIAARVGHEIILLSELEEQLHFYEAQLGPAVRDTIDRDRMRSEILEGMINDHLLVTQAERAGIEVTTGEITNGVEEHLAVIRANFPSESAFQEEISRSGLELSQLRQSYRDIVRRQLLARRVIEREVYSRVRVTDEEVLAFFEEHRDEVPDLPERVTLAHILVTPEVSSLSEATALERLTSIRRELEEGIAFEELARRYSEAPGAERGGMLGTFRRGDLDPAFAAAESAAFALSPGEVSGPVRTGWGLHLIRLVDRERDRVRAQHILIELKPSGEDTAAARNRAAEVLARVRAGEDFARLAAEYSDDEVTRDEGGFLGVFEWEGLTPEYRGALGGLAPGEITPVLTTPQGFQLVRLVERETSHAPAFEEVESRLREILIEERAREKYEEWLGELRESIFIEVVRANRPTGG